MILIKTTKEIETLAEGGKLLAAVLEHLEKEVKIGATTGEINSLAERLIAECGGKPSFSLPEADGGGGFPAATCISINDEVVHGIPGSRAIKDGDLVTVDVGMIYKGFHTDTALTVGVGQVDPEMHRMLRVTKKALKYAIKKARQGNTFGDVGNTIERYVESQGFPRDFGPVRPRHRPELARRSASSQLRPAAQAAGHQTGHGFLPGADGDQGKSGNR